MENIDFKHVNDDLPRYGENFDYGGQKSDWCVYVHINKINGKMYIGVSSNLKNRWSGNGKRYFGCNAIYNAFNYYGWDNFEHIILMNGLTKDMADIIEKEMIAKYKSYAETDNGYNIAGGGLSGGSFVDRSFSYAPIHQYDLQGRYIQSFDSRIQAELLINGKYGGRIGSCLKENHYAHGFLWNDVLVDSMPSYEEIMKPKKPNIEIISYDPISKEIKKYKNTHAISDDRVYRTRVMKCCRNNQNKKITICDDKYWFFSDDFQNINFQEIDYHYENIYKKIRPIYMFKNGILIKSFKSAVQANKETGVNFANILAVCHGKRKTMGGYQWSFEKTLNNIIYTN